MRVTPETIDSAIAEGHPDLELEPGNYDPIRCRTRTTLTAIRQWTAHVRGREGHGVYLAAGGVVTGLRVTGADYAGVRFENGQGGIVRRCWLARNGNGIAAHHAQDLTIAENLVEFNGHHVQFYHGLYASGLGLRIERNVFRHNSGWAVHLVPEVHGAKVTSNLIHGQAGGHGIVIWGGADNLVANNTIDEADPLDIRGADNLVANNWVEHFDVVDRVRGVYWPIAARPGEAGHVAEDFWGQVTEGDYEGCFPYRPHMTRPEWRRSWSHGWPYYIATDPMPNPWSNGEAGTLNVRMD